MIRRLYADRVSGHRYAPELAHVVRSASDDFEIKSGASLAREPWRHVGPTCHWSTATALGE